MHNYEQSLKFGGGFSETFLSPFALALTLLTAILIFSLPRKYVVIPVLVTSIFIPMGQQLVLGGLHFYISRLIVLAAWMRIMSSGWLRSFSLSRIDKVLLFWGFADAIAFVALWREQEAVINRLGFLYSVFGFYFLFRVL